MFEKRRSEEGFSLIEVLATLLIILILSSIALPYYSNERMRGYLNTARQDGDSLSREILASVQDVGTLGTSNGTISYDSSTHTVTIALGTGVTSPSPFPYILSANTTAAGITYANTTKWCVAVANNGQSAFFTDLGQNTSIALCPTTPSW